MKTPEDVAREIVPSILKPGSVRISDTSGDAWVTLRDEDDISALRRLFERVVEKAMREGAAAALAGQRPSDLVRPLPDKLEAWRFVRYGRDLTGRIRSLVNRYTDIWLALGTWDPEGEASVAECLAILRGILRVERGVLGVDSTSALLERARGDAASMPESLRGKMLVRLVAEIETIVRERGEGEPLS